MGPAYQENSIKEQTTYKLKIFAVSYNILRIVNGMGGLAYNS
jgi:hypothetical protein